MTAIKVPWTKSLSKRTEQSSFSDDRRLAVISEGHMVHVGLRSFPMVVPSTSTPVTSPL